ncbi:hypothetical protein BRD18_01565 [Halobacteriales archaeon SW_7_71_33]|nr:MAG: hypothetical protein BRD18_01565 [Halobacteriales archaeon SW_7_71_33]
MSVRSALSADRSLVDGAVFAVGFAALVAAVVVAFGGPLGDPLVGALAPVFGSWLVGVGGLLAGGLAVYTAYERSRLPDPETDASVPVPPSRQETTSVATAGGRLDALIEEVHADDLDDDVSRVDVSVNRKRVRDRVREVAVETLTDTRDCSPEAAGEMLVTGSWTDRPRARVFLGRGVAPLPLSVRLRDWASGEGFRRRARATIEEIATQAGVDHGESIAPAPVGVDEVERDTVQWPPEPTTDDDRIDRLLERPPEEFEEVSEPEPDPEPRPGEAESGSDPEVFHREVIPGDAAGAAGSASSSSPSRRAEATGDGTVESADADDREPEREQGGESE